MRREVDSCPHRIDDEVAAGPDTAECGLLRRISGVQERTQVRVRRDLCEACCESFAPSERIINPPLASALFEVARGILARGGSPGCDQARATQLMEWAEENLSAGWGELAASQLNGLGDEGRKSSQTGQATARIGLIGWNTPSGLGEMNRQLASHLPIDRWLIPHHSVFREVAFSGRCAILRDPSRSGIEKFLDGLDWVLFCELPYLDELVGAALARGVKIACVPMWEYLDEFLLWIPHVDRMICPTRACFQMMLQWRERAGPRWDVELVRWPIDLERFPFRPREVCRKFLFVNGTGGLPTSNDRPRWDGRKGAAIIAEAARRVPEIPIIVRSQTTCLPAFPPNVEVRIGDIEDSGELYADGDVCLQPSRWEGLGLPLLECQASGLPLVTTDAPPMNEYNPLHVIKSVPTRFRLFGTRKISAHDADPVELAAVMRELHGKDISDASLGARRYVETVHSWSEAGARLRELLS
jgi:glycosyltransferase involved in cell wall biosynthesis